MTKIQKQMLFSQSIRSGCLLVTLTILTCQAVLILAAGETYDASCDSAKVDEHRTVDTCDRERFLVCKEGRCLCQDQANQIWTYRTIKASKGSSSSARSRRSPKKGGGKKIIAAAAAGAAGGYIASHAIRGSSGGIGSKQKEKVVHYYGCYSRVKGQCVLDSALIGGDVIVAINNKPTDAATTSTATTTTTTTTTTANTSTVAPPAVPVTVSTAQAAAPANPPVATPGANVTTAPVLPPAPQAMAQTSQFTYDVTRIPKCVEHAECKTMQVKIVDGKVVSSISHDPRLGVCECMSGYKATKTGTCEKSGALRSSSNLLVVFLMSMIVISKSFFIH